MIAECVFFLRVSDLSHQMWWCTLTSVINIRFSCSLWHLWWYNVWRGWGEWMTDIIITSAFTMQHIDCNCAFWFCICLFHLIFSAACDCCIVFEEEINTVFVQYWGRVCIDLRQHDSGVIFVYITDQQTCCMLISSVVLCVIIAADLMKRTEMLID